MAVELTRNIKDFLKDPVVQDKLKKDDLAGALDLINTQRSWRDYYIPEDEIGILYTFLAEIGINIFDAYDKVDARLNYNSVELSNIEIVGKTSIIGADFLQGNTSVKRLVIGDNVTSIGNRAFADCPNLETVVMGDNIEVIGQEAFANCPKLHRLVLPESVRILKKDALKANDNCYIFSVPRKRGSLKAYGDLAWLKQHLGVDPSFRENSEETVVEEE